MASSQIIVREVWEENLLDEFDLIHQSLDEFSFISMDTEFPGTVFNPTHIPKHLLSTLSQPELYFLMKNNVNSLNLIQLGLTLFDANGNLPHFDTGFQYVWQFNFRDFNRDSDLQNQESVSLLERQGIDFSKNRTDGIDSSDFADLLVSCIGGRSLKWITFSGLYDYGFLIKILTGRRLPRKYNDFLMLMEDYFGAEGCDVKPMAKQFGLLGGLEKIADALDLERAAGTSHQAGSDSLLTMQVFMKLKMMHISANRPMRRPVLVLPMRPVFVVRRPCTSISPVPVFVVQNAHHY